jgi:hypothetical protein
MLLVCCFCDQIRDESMGHGHWREQLYGSMGSRTPKREETVLSYTCCHNCLKDDPGAIAFRARQSPSHASVLPAKARSRGSIAA